MSPTPAHPEPDGEAEPALGENREEDEAAGDDRLYERERRERHGAHVEAPCAEGDEHAEREPLGAEQAHCAGHGMAEADVRRRASSAMLRRKPRFVAKAQKSARRMPSSIVKKAKVVRY